MNRAATDAGLQKEMLEATKWGTPFGDVLMTELGSNLEKVATEAPTGAAGSPYFTQIKQESIDALAKAIKG